MIRQKRAFTFIELMFVVVIIGILATLVTTTVTRQMTIVRRNTTATGIRTISAALQTFERDHGRFPTNQEGLGALLEDKRANRAGYLNEPHLPRDGWGTRFLYKAPGENRVFFDLWSAGPDRKDGTGDEVTNWSEGPEVGFPGDGENRRD